jgi:peptidoglycan/LPS O-acetylase OafA/YrhL
MWGRVIEIIIGLWLVLSPFVWGHYPSNPGLWRSDVISGIAVIGLAVLSFWPFRRLRFLRYAHVGILFVASWVVVFSYFTSGHPAAPGYQNALLTGLTLMLVAIIPNDASQPPTSWRRYYQSL